MNEPCPHVAAVPEAMDQTLGVACNDCNDILGYCWGDEHVPESLWNRAVAHLRSVPDSDGEDWIPCVDSRDDVCAICQKPIVAAVANEGTP